MSSYGSISAMLVSLKNNKIPKREKKLGHIEYVKGVPIGKPLRYKNKLTAEEMRCFQEKLKHDKRHSTRMTIVVLILSILITIFFVQYYLISGITN